MVALEIVWNVNPMIAKFGNFELRWYGLFFAMGFLLGYKIMYYIFQKENKSQRDFDTLLMVMIFGTIIGARVGHYFFYEFEQLKESPVDFFIDMVIPPYRGLASHGAALGILTGLFLYSRKHKDQPFLWLVDRIAITVAIGGGFIRLGNLINHEILGKATSLPWGFRFNYIELSPDGSLIMTPENVTRHPAQLYEAISCFLLAVVLLLIWKKYKQRLPHGLLTGIFFIWIFGLRFFFEFVKENQKSFEDGMMLNMGQILSIPIVVLGIGIFCYALINGKKDATKMSLAKPSKKY